MSAVTGTRRSQTVVASSVLSLVTGVLLVPITAHGDQILEIHDASLTTYVPSAKSNIQDIRPLVDQRAVGVEGNTENCGCGGGGGGPGFFGNCADPTVWPAGLPRGGDVRGRFLAGIDLFTGTFVINDVDLSFPADVPWVIGRSYNARQKDSGGSYYASGGYQGDNCFQGSQPELVFHDSGTDSEDMVYLIYGADRYIEFRRGDDQGTGDSTDTFRAVNGAAGAILLYTFDGIDLATYYDQRGYRYDFFWFGDADVDDDIEGAIWRIMDPTIDVDPYDTADRLVTTDGNVAYVGDIGNPNTALSSYDATNGGIKTAYDSTGRRFTYDYTSGNLDFVKAEVNAGGWTEVGKVDYSYYIAADAHGEDNDLELVTITMPLTDSGVSSVSKKYYWYYEGAYNATTNPGYHHQLQYIIDREGYRNHDWDQDSNLDDDPLTATEAALKAYASGYFEYDTQRRIVASWFNGACGCSGAASGEHTFEYEGNTEYSNGAGYDSAETEWKMRTVVKKPDVTYKTASGAIESWVTQYFDEVGQPLHRVRTDGDPDGSPNLWATRVIRNSSGQLTTINSPANVTAYTHTIGGGWGFTTSTSAGLVTLFTQISSGDTTGYPEYRKHQTGTSGSAYLDSKTGYSERTLTVGDAGVTRPLVSGRRVYSQEITSGTTGSHQTTVSYTFHSATATDVQYIAPKRITKTNPSVSTANNGSNSSTTSKRYLRKDGSKAFTESESSSFTYTQFTDGQLTKRIDDAQTNHATDFASGDDPNTDFGITETSDGVRRITTYAYDSQGRSDTVTQSSGRVGKRYYTELADARLVALSYADYEDLATDKFYGPVSYNVANHAGKSEWVGTIALRSDENSGEYTTRAITTHIDEAKSDPITAIAATPSSGSRIGNLQLGVSASIYEETGAVLQESRAYFNIPSSGAGSDGTNYDATFFGYDDQGRRVRTEAPHGTLNRTDYDALGRVERQWIGTNDSDFDGGDSAGTDDMVKIMENVYDSGADEGNSYLTKRTLYVEDSATDKRETTFDHDVRGRVLLTTNEAAPHIFNKYDNMGRPIASGQFSSTASIVVGTDDPTTETTNRLALSQRFYEEMGRVWKSQRHKIDDADGSDDDNLQTLTWYDKVGRVIKVDGSQLAKMAHDRLGRQTHQFILASDDDTAYANADDVTGDIVLREAQTTFESTNSDDILMSAVIDRHHDDKGAGETTGALDTNADSDDLKYTATNVEGRIQITAMWYDRLGRVTDTVRYGAYGGSDFDRDGLSVPARSDTALLTEQTYNTDGTLKSTTDPRNLETRFEYNDLGKPTLLINNYVNGTPSGDNGDDDLHTRNIHADGLLSKTWIDFDGDDVVDTGDQETIYTYGTTKGVSAGDSKIETGHLLQKVQYPDSSGGTDVVNFAYNAQSQQIWTKDQAGNIIETDYDDSGRTEHKRITTLDADFDGAVRRISTTYDSLGRAQLVTQYDNATVGSGTVVNEVKYTFEDWGNLEKFEQDHNSTVSTGGNLLYDVDYTYAKATTGRNTIRRTGLTLPDGNVITYTFDSAGNLHDDEVSRVTGVKDGAVKLAVYKYNGTGQVVGTDHAEPDIMWNLYGATSGDYPDLDRFNRVTSSRWTKDLATDVDFYDTDITYDRNSNITLIEDNIHGGFDVDYTMDNLNRLQKAEEGTWNGSSITSRSRQQIWEDASNNLALDQVGNWTYAKLDLNGDGVFTGTGEYKDDRTHNDVNELTGRDTDDNGTDNFTLIYDEVGNLTDDGEHYEYVYDAFGRLRKINDTSDQTLVAEYEYNGLGHRVSWHYDTEPDGDVDANDPTYYFAYDERWRIVATFRGTDSSPKEQFVHHNAGANGRGGSSYIDAVIMRDKDANTAWTSASDGTLEERIYYCQNWRSDVVVTVDSGSDVIEHARFSSYGVPYGMPAGDTDADGDEDSTDDAQIQTWIDADPAVYDIRGDLDLDGDTDATDKTKAQANGGKALGWGDLSHANNDIRRGSAGYELDSALDGAYRIYHVRNRVLNVDTGRFLQRDMAMMHEGNGYSLGAMVQDDPPLPEIIGCNALDKVLIEQCFKNSLKDLWDLVSQECGDHPPRIICAPCGDPNKCALYNPDPNIIVYCTDGNCPFVCTSIGHELIHAWQYCACQNVIWENPEVFEFIWTDCENTICRELAAYENEDIFGADPCAGADDQAKCYCKLACTSASNCVGPDKHWPDEDSCVCACTEEIRGNCFGACAEHGLP